MVIVVDKDPVIKLAIFSVIILFLYTHIIMNLIKMHTCTNLMK